MRFDFGRVGKIGAPLDRELRDIDRGEIVFFRLKIVEGTPPRIPQTVVVMFDPQPSFVTVNTSRQITVYAIYKNSDSENGTKAIRAVDVTDNCSYQSSNESVAVCSLTGLVKSTGPGMANITAFYTAPPWSANMSNAAAGKIPVTITAEVGVFVK